MIPNCINTNLIKYFIISFYANIPNKSNFSRYTKRVIEAIDINDANNQASKIIKDEGVRYEPYYVKLVPEYQVALVKKQIKDTRKLRYQSNSY